MNYLFRYLYIIPLFVLFVACSKEENVDGNIENVAIRFDTKSSVDESNEGDLIGVTLVNEFETLYFGQYKVDSEGAIKPNSDPEFYVRTYNYTVMYSGVKAGSEDKDRDPYTKVPESGTLIVKDPDTGEKIKPYGDCSVYAVHRSGKDENGVEDIYIGVPDVNYLHFTGNSLVYDSTNKYYSYYILDADIKLKQQYSKMKFSLKSDKYDVYDNPSSGHYITEVGVTNLIDKAYICPVHGMHYNPDTDIDNSKIGLTYDGTPDADGKVLVTESKDLTGGDDGDGYVNILSGDYSDVDLVTQKPVLTSPCLYVTYSGTTPLTNYLPIMADLEPQTEYKFEATLTNLQINVVIYKLEGWEDGVDGEDGNGVVTKVAKYSVKVTPPDGWDGNYEISGTI